MVLFLILAAGRRFWQEIENRINPLDKPAPLDYNLCQNVALKRVSTDEEHHREKAIGGRLLWEVSGTCLGALYENTA